MARKALSTVMQVLPPKVDVLLDKLNHDLGQVDRVEPAGNFIYELCAQVWDFDAFVFNVRRGRRSFHFRTAVLVDMVDGERVHFPSTESNVSDASSIWSRLLSGKGTLINRTVQNDVDLRGTFGDKGRLSSSLMYAPVMLGDSVVGSLSLQSYTPQKFDESDLAALVAIARLVAPAVTRCRAEERMHEFLQMGALLNQAKDTTEVTRVVSEAAANLLGWDVISIHLQEAGTGIMHLILGLERNEHMCTIYPSTEVRIPEQDSILSEVLSGNVVQMNIKSAELAKKSWYYPFATELPLMSSVVVAPIRSMNHVIGLLCIQSNSTDAYLGDEEEIVRALAEYCSGALERAWAQQNLQKSEENYRLLVENVNDGIVISQNDRFAFYNHRFAAMLGYEYEELQNKTYKDIYTQRGMEILQQRTAFRKAGLPVPDRYETLFHKKSGDTVPVEADVRIIEDFHGAPATFGIIRDISERKAAEKKLHRSEQEMRALFGAMTDVILVLDSEGNCLNGDTRGQHLRVTPWEPLVTKSLSETFSPEKSNYLLALIRRSLSSRETLNVEFDLPVNSDGTVWYNATMSPLSDKTVLMVARDITERRQAEEELFRSNARYKALLDGSEDYIFVLDKDLRFVHVNSVVEKRYGFSPQQRIGKTLADLYENKSMPYFVKSIQSVFETGQPIMYDDDAVINGRLICTETVVSPVYSMHNEVEAVLGISRDVTSRRQSAAALKRSEERYAGAARATNDGIWDLNLESGKIYLSPRWWAIIGNPEHNLDGEFDPTVWYERVHPEDLQELQRKIYEHINGLTPHLQDEHRIRHEDGNWRWVLCRGLCVLDDAGRPSRLAGSISDITDRKSAESLLLYGATHDVLTNLPNRAHFLKSLHRAMNDVKSGKRTGACAVLFLDLDRFKVVNDSLGHLAGDDLICETARRIERSVRPGDLVARMGGDEFTVMLMGACKDVDVIAVANRIINEVSQPLELDGFRVQTTVSMGIAFFQPHYQKPEELLRDADTAMYRAKAAGRNRYQIFDQQMHSAVMKQLQLEADLRQAVAMQQFVIYYQPIYKVSNMSLFGFEALIRWNHPTRGFITPDEFIDLAEETGLIIPIGWWVLDQALRDCQVWNRDRMGADRLTVSVNMSPRQFLQPTLIDHVRFLLEHTGAEPSDLIVEVTENLLMEDSPLVANGLAQLRLLGIRLDLDDFGTGYSSLSFLRRFPLDLLKIDRSFISDLGTDSHSGEIVGAIIALARGLHLPVTAEGVETEEQLNFLRALDCDFAQGYFFSKPMPIDQALEYAAQERIRV